MADFIFLIEPFSIVIITIILSLISGWGITYRINLEPLEKLAVCALTGFALMYFFEFGAYLLSLPPWAPFLLLLLTSLITTSICIFKYRPEISPTISITWRGVLAWLTTSLWGLAIQFQIVVYGAPTGWFGDWWEQYERSIFFLKQLPPDTLFLNDIWSLPARGPLFNSVTALLMGGLGNSFWVYQILATTLSSFCVLPMALLLKKISKLDTTWALIISVLLLCLTPFSMQQIIYPWTKMFTTGFILAGIYFYIVGQEKEKNSFFIGSFLFFSLGFLTHYMTILFAIFFVVHFIFYTLKKERTLKAIVPPLLVIFLVLSTWFSFLIPTFGFKGALLANNTLGNVYKSPFKNDSGLQFSRYQLFWENMRSTFIPFSFRYGWVRSGAPEYIKEGWPYHPIDLKSREKVINTHMTWKLDLINDQGSFTGNVGYAGGLIGIISLLYLRKSNDLHPKTVQPGWKFWSTFFILGILLHISAYGAYDVQGVSYASLQPYLFLLVTFLINGLRIITKRIRVILIGLFFLESAYKSWVWVQLHQRTVNLQRIYPEGFAIRGPELNGQYVSNHSFKMENGIVFLSDQFGQFSGFLSLMSIGLILVILTSSVVIWFFSFKRTANISNK